MGFFRLLLRPRWRLFFFGLVALGLQIALLLISPAQVPVVLVPCQAVLGIWASGISWDLGGTGGTGS